MNGMKSCWAVLYDSAQRRLLKKNQKMEVKGISKGPRKEPNTREIDQ